MDNFRENLRIEGEYNHEYAADCVNGIFVGRAHSGVVTFRGIPFAKPPVGPLRWKDPVPVDPAAVSGPAEAAEAAGTASSEQDQAGASSAQEAGAASSAQDPAGATSSEQVSAGAASAETARKPVFQAYYNGSSPIQTRLDSERASMYHQSEDCLYLNVWTAEGFAGQNRAVMVFIHGGSYGWGGTADPIYDGHNFVKAHPEIVMVTIAYRTGIAGFIDFSEVPGGEEYISSGNLGLLDQICALEYVQENIRSFGGDPENVTIFGESAGAGSVSLLPLIPAAKGLFSKVIAESGSISLTYSRKDCQAFTRKLRALTGAKNMKELVALSEEQLKAVNQKLNDENNFPERDGVVLPEDLYGAYERGAALSVPMMIGTNADELRYWIQDVGGVRKYRLLSNIAYESMLKHMKKEDRQRAEQFLNLQAAEGATERPWQITEFCNEIMFRLPAIRQATAHAAWGNPVYMYYWKYPSSLPDMGACHAVELAYVFNNPQEIIYTGEGVNKELASQVQQMWANFALRGDPSTEEVLWEPYSADARRTMILDEEIRMTTDLMENGRVLLWPLLDYGFNGNPQGFTLNIPFVYKSASVAVAALAGLGSALAITWKVTRKLRK